MQEAIRCAEDWLNAQHQLELEKTRTQMIATLSQGLHAGEIRVFTLPGDVSMEMVWCPAGTFVMGSPQGEADRSDKEAQHLVKLTEGFWIAKTEVTQRQWESVMTNNPSRFKGDELPVETVSWNDCQEFCEKVGLRLPTEAEWEYACRAGSKTVFFWGNALNGDRANCDGNVPYGTTVKGPSIGKTVPVGSYLPNAWGIFDMHGNVAEWCADWYDIYKYRSEINPMGPALGTERVMRGGGWFNVAAASRAAKRYGFSPARGLFYCGFRPCYSEKQQ